MNGTLSVLLAARDAAVSFVVDAAYSSAYGDQPQVLKSEDMLQKLAVEHYTQASAPFTALETVRLR